MTLKRTHHCGALTEANLEQEVVLMGWAQSVRHLGGVLFLDIRDFEGITQVVVAPQNPFFALAESIRQESVVWVQGAVKRREGAQNPKLLTGSIEVVAKTLGIESASQILPFPVTHNTKVESEDTRLKYRFLDLRTAKMQGNVLFYNKVIASLRKTMWGLGFNEFQTPILTSSSPEGARDFLVPSRLHPGKFYALPQAPQQFKQLLMCSGFDKYFQIAPCFRDEDPRADRAPGEFYQLDLEMAFVDQEDLFAHGEQIMRSVFTQCAPHKKLPEGRFLRLTWRQAMEEYGSDKPDLRFDLKMNNVNSMFKEKGFVVFKNALEKGLNIKAMKLPNAANQSRKFFDELDLFSKELGFGGLPWLGLVGTEWKGSCAKALGDQEKSALKEALKLEAGDAAIFVLTGTSLKELNASGKLRNHLGQKLALKDDSAWSFLWVTDFPFYEWNEEENKLDFSHNPFSMPKGGMDALLNQNPLEINAFQYDMVCNGYEIASGAIRNHKSDVMVKAFELAGYTEDIVKERFGALWEAFQYGAPPHGGMAFGLARIVMIMLDEPNIREVLAFPMNGKAVDLLMGAPSLVNPSQLDSIHIQLKPNPLLTH